MKHLCSFLVKGLCEKALEHGIETERVNKILNVDHYTEKLHDVGLVLTSLRAYLDDECMGFTKNPARPNSLIYALRLGIAAETLEGFLRIVFDFYTEFVPDITIVGERINGQYVISTKVEYPEYDSKGFLKLFLLMAIHRVANWFIHKRIPLKNVLLDIPEISTTKSELEKIFICPVSFSKNINQISFDEEILSLKKQQNSHGVERYFERRPLDVLTMVGDEIAYKPRIKNMLYAHQARGILMPSIEELSDTFHLSPQTLRRYLIKEGVSYRGLKDEVRKEIAMDKLMTTNLSISDIAELAGFLEVNSFSRAFKRWTGESPKAFKKNESDKNG